MVPAALAQTEHPPATHFVSTAFHRYATHPMPTARIIAFSASDPSHVLPAFSPTGLPFFIFGKCL